MPRKHAELRLPAPYLRRIWRDPDRILVERRDRYPFGLALFLDGFELAFDRPITIIVGENEARKSDTAQVILATHSPILMTYPGANLLAAHARGFEGTTLEETSHDKLIQDYARDARGFVARAITDERACDPERDRKECRRACRRS